MSNAFQQEIKAKALLHLRLTYDDWKESFKSLTRAELGVFFAIRTQDPFGDRELEIDSTVLGEELGLHRTSVSRALESLSQKKLIDLEISRARVKLSVKNRRLTLLTEAENESNDEQNREIKKCALTHTLERPRTQTNADAHERAPAHTPEHPHTKREAKPPPLKRPRIPHTNQTLEDKQNTTELEPGGSVLEIFEKYGESLKTYAVYIRIRQDELIVLNPKLERIIQQIGHVPPSKIDAGIRAFLTWIRNAKDVVEP